MLIIISNELIIFTVKKSQSPKQRKYVYKFARILRIKKEMIKKALGILSTSWWQFLLLWVHCFQSLVHGISADFFSKRMVFDFCLL